MLLKPVGRKIAPEITLATLCALEKGNDPMLVVTPADQTVTDGWRLQKPCSQPSMKRIKAKGIEIILYGPTLQEDRFFNSHVFKDLNQFKVKVKADVIVANRCNSDLSDVADKVYSRDLSGVDN